MKRTVRLLALAAAPVLLLAACGSSGADEASPSTEVTAKEAATQEEAEGAEVAPSDDGGDDTDASEENPAWPDVDDASEEQGFYGAGQYLAMNFTGAGYILDVPAEGPDDIEAFREATGQDPVGYIKVEIDNTNGYEDAQPNGATVVDTDGNEYEYESAFIALDEWGPTMRDDGPEDENDGYWYAMPDGTAISEDEYDELSSMSVEVYNDHLDTSASPTAKKTVWLIGPELPERMSYIELQDVADSYQASPLE